MKLIYILDHSVLERGSPSGCPFCMNETSCVERAFFVEFGLTCSILTPVAARLENDHV